MEESYEFDTFQLRATIKKLERERDLLVIGLLVIGSVIGYFFKEDFSPGEYLIAWLVYMLWLVLFLELRNTRIDVFRASLRDILTKRNPSILSDPDW